ncbi:MAG: hypothetical protein KDC98_15195 [Planctomycetes bacterium]|nr:hypothetical protein [Planctomycetota bacterium]
MRTLAVVSSSIAVLASVTMAQTYIVDVNNGPGTNFTSIAAAVAQVPNGSVLDVRAGDYPGFAITGKSLTVMGRPGARISGLAYPPIRIEAIAAQDTVVVSGLQISHVSVIATVACRNSTGAIVVDDCRSDPGTSLVGGQLEVTDCANVLARDSTFVSSTYFTQSLVLQRSRLVATSCTFSSQMAIPVAITDGVLDLTACAVTAGVVPPTVALHLSHIDVRRGCVLGATATGGAILSGSGSANVDPTTTLQNASSTPFAPSVAVNGVALPWLSASFATPSGIESASLSGSGTMAALAIGEPGPGYAIAGPLQVVGLRAGTELIMAAGPPPLAASFVVPTAPWVRGVTLTWQGVVLGSAGLQVSNAIGVVLP